MRRDIKLLQNGYIQPPHFLKIVIPHQHDMQNLQIGKANPVNLR